MKHYSIYIKSHDESPDYEDHVEAHTKEEAMDYFLVGLNKGEESWDYGMIDKYVAEV